MKIMKHFNKCTSNKDISFLGQMLLVARTRINFKMYMMHALVFVYVISHLLCDACTLHIHIYLFVSSQQNIYPSFYLFLSDTRLSNFHICIWFCVFTSHTYVCICTAPYCDRCTTKCACTNLFFCFCIKSYK